MGQLSSVEECGAHVLSEDSIVTRNSVFRLAGRQAIEDHGDEHGPQTSDPLEGLKVLLKGLRVRGFRDRLPGLPQAPRNFREGWCHPPARWPEVRQRASSSSDRKSTR